ncbi:response regulator [Hyalangium versicolor]|uniref:response regulator n=1 Tax=Hyalangium versicolor TaxID=2861190 RepID=UPI001CCE7E2F|nr:response regulator [Hyalangium versicolor]
MVRMKTPSFLFVDQDPMWLAALRRASRDLPGPMHFAHSAEEALVLLRAFEPSVVVSGYSLPGEDGLTLLERVKEESPHVACVLHTSRPPKQLRSARGIALVEKGGTPRALQAALNALWEALTGKPPAPSRNYLI